MHGVEGYRPRENKWKVIFSFCPASKVSYWLEKLFIEQNNKRIVKSIFKIKNKNIKSTFLTSTLTPLLHYKFTMLHFACVRPK